MLVCLGGGIGFFFFFSFFFLSWLVTPQIGRDLADEGVSPARSIEYRDQYMSPFPLAGSFVCWLVVTFKTWVGLGYSGVVKLRCCKCGWLTAAAPELPSTYTKSQSSTVQVSTSSFRVQRTICFSNISNYD